MKRAKRISALLLAAFMLISLLPISSFAGVKIEPLDEDNVTIVGWDFESETNIASTASANNADAVVARESEISFSYAAGNGSSKALKKKERR